MSEAVSEQIKALKCPLENYTSIPRIELWNHALSAAAALAQAREAELTKRVEEAVCAHVSLRNAVSRALGTVSSETTTIGFEQHITSLTARLADCQLLGIVAADDGLAFNEPIGDCPGEIAIREWSSDNSIWHDHPCEYVTDASGWSYPVITDEIRAALKAALTNGTDEQWARYEVWRKENPHPGDVERDAITAILERAGVPKFVEQRLEINSADMPMDGGQTCEELTLPDRVEALVGERDWVSAYLTEIGIERDRTMLDRVKLAHDMMECTLSDEEAAHAETLEILASLRARHADLLELLGECSRLLSTCEFDQPADLELLAKLAAQLEKAE